MTELETLQAQIEALNEEANPYRRLPDDDIRKDRLRVIVDEINTLRRQESYLLTGYKEKPVPVAEMQPVHLAQAENEGQRPLLATVKRR